jgi:hypothetical protein
MSLDLHNPEAWRRYQDVWSWVAFPEQVVMKTATGFPGVARWRESPQWVG